MYHTFYELSMINLTFFLKIVHGEKYMFPFFGKNVHYFVKTDSILIFNKVSGLMKTYENF